MKAREIPGTETRPVPSHCMTCAAPTKHNKPYCSKHLTSHAYASHVASQVQQMEKEMYRLNRGKSVSRDALIVQEAVRALEWEGIFTIEGLRKYLGLEMFGATRLVRQLKTWGLVVLTPAPRGKTHITLP